MNNPVNEIICGDALSVLKTLPDSYVQCVVTSPPYYCLRSYLPDDHPDKHLEIGLEETPQEFVANLVGVFREVRRVLRSDGVLWVNIGDTYANDQKWGGKTSGKHVNAVKGTFPRAKRYTGLPGKNLIGIPWRLAFALQDDGWILRSDIIWDKTNCMPESVTDRCTRSHEYIFMLTKNDHYYYNQDAIREPHVTASNVRDRGKEGKWASGALLTPIGEGLREWNHPNGRNKRDVWAINTSPFPEAHFAVMPPKLVEPCVLAASKPGDIILDPFAGAGTVPLVALQHSRNYLGIELNPEYIKLTMKRIETIQPTLWSAVGEEVSA